MPSILSLAALALPILAHVLPALAAECSATIKCPASAPCCSEYGFCGSGYYCQQGCEPLHSYALNSCRPNPICRSSSISFPENLSRLHMNATQYNGNASAWDWVVNSGYAVPMSDGLRLTLNQTNSGTKISSTRYVHYGKIEFVMQTSRWAGVVSAAITMSDVKDEIDWEWTGTATNEAQTNVWFLGIANYSNSLGETVQMGTDTADGFHKYTLDWQPDQLIWAIDDRIVRTLQRTDTLSPNGQQYMYPTTPSRVQVSIWPGGIPASAPGTIEWAGGMIQWNEPEYRQNGYYWNTLKSVSVQCWPEAGVAGGTTGWVYAANNSQGIPQVTVTNASTLINAAGRLVVRVEERWLAAGAGVVGALLAGLAVL